MGYQNMLSPVFRWIVVGLLSIGCMVALTGPSVHTALASPGGAAPQPVVVASQLAPESASASGLVGKLNLNTASEEQLQLLPTVGPAKALRIVEWRKKNGAFKRVADLRRVKGFGYKTLKRLEPFLDIRGDNTLVGKS